MTAKVVILNWNGEQVLPRFLPSVVADTPPEVEIVVADNGSTDGSVELMRRDFPSVRLVLLERNFGFAGGYNRALEMLDAEDSPSGSQHAAGAPATDHDGGPADIYILLNSDVETPAGWCGPLIEMLENQPDVAAVAPKILSFTEPEKFEYAGASGGFIDTLGYPFCRGRILGTIEIDTGQYDDAREVFWATGACFACRADVFRALGGFDEAFFAHQEEIDLCWRMRLAGWRVMVEPRSKVFHLGAGTLAPSPQKLYLNHRNNLLMLHKNLSIKKMHAVIFVRMVLDGVAAVVYLLQGRPRNFGSVVRAHRDFRRMKNEKTAGNSPENSRKTVVFASEIAGNRQKNTPGIYHKSVILSYLFGNRKFSQLKVK